LRRSIKVTSTGARLSFWAAFSPAKPPPKITTLCFCVIFSCSLRNFARNLVSCYNIRTFNRQTL